MRVELSPYGAVIPPGLGPFLRKFSVISLVLANMDGLHPSLSFVAGTTAAPLFPKETMLDSSTSPPLDSAFCTPELLLEDRFFPSVRVLVSPTAASTARSSLKRIRTP